MRLLVDTHAVVWFALDLPGLSTRAKTLLENVEVTPLLSPVSAFEVALKHRLGKWPEALPLMADYTLLTRVHGFESLPLRDEHALMAGKFTQPHRDPFDRLIAAQALSEGIAIVSADPALDAFGVTRLW